MSHYITLREAATMTTNYLEKREAILDDQYQGRDILAKHETFDATTVRTILDQDGCAGFRVYFGMDTDSKVHVILVGVNEANEDMLPADMDAPNTQIAEKAMRCPVICAPASALNTER
ncbi:MAG TPA: hypothetical protein VFZ78_01385 [Flavisolibacter sp.]